MVVSISFAELHAYVAAHYQKDLSFSQVSDRELRVTFTQKVLIKDVHISVDIHIDQVESESVALTYKGGMALDMIISGALNLLKTKLPELSRGIVADEHHAIRVNLSEIEKAKSFVANVALRDIRVDDSAIQVTLALK